MKKLAALQPLSSSAFAWRQGQLTASELAIVLRRAGKQYWDLGEDSGRIHHKAFREQEDCEGLREGRLLEGSLPLSKLCVLRVASPVRLCSGQADQSFVAQTLLQNGAEMPDSLVSTLWNIIQRLKVSCVHSEMMPKMALYQGLARSDMVQGQALASCRCSGQHHLSPWSCFALV